MVHGIRLMLLLFAAVGFGAAGAALAVARYRLLGDGEHDYGLAAIAFLLGLFATLCTVAAGGLAGILAFGGVIVWASYLLTGQRLGLFTIETHSATAAELEPTEQRR
jgi:hypothetical protein